MASYRCASMPAALNLPHCGAESALRRSTRPQISSRAAASQKVFIGLLRSQSTVDSLRPAADEATEPPRLRDSLVRELVQSTSLCLGVAVGLQIVRLSNMPAAVDANCFAGDEIALAEKQHRFRNLAFTSPSSEGRAFGHRFEHFLRRHPRGAYRTACSLINSRALT